MTRLRAAAYVLTSIASLLFIGLVLYGAVQLDRLSTTLEQLTSPSLSTIEMPAFDPAAPADPTLPVP